MKPFEIESLTSNGGLFKTNNLLCDYLCNSFKCTHYNRAL